MKNAISDLIQISQYAGNRVDYTQGGGGNTSVKLDQHTMVIKASGYRLKDISDSKGFVTLEYQSIKNFIHDIKDINQNSLDVKHDSLLAQSIIKTEGQIPLRPSVETGFHSILDKYVIHTHSIYANLINCASEGFDLLKTIFKYADFSYISIPYINPGLKLSYVINQAMNSYQAKHNTRPEVIFLTNHGLIVTSNDIDRVIYLHTEVNERIRIFFGLEELPINTSLIRLDDTKYQSNIPFMHDSLKHTSFSLDLLNKYPLYPDQLVFLNNILHTEPQKLSIVDHKVIYNTDQKEAETMNESLFAFLFIVTTLTKNHIRISVMNEEDIAFINGWEAEKYRKKLALKGDNQS